MKEKVYTFNLTLNWKLLRVISQIDRFDASWTSIEKKEGKSLKQLKNIATIQSVGASTRIEGSKMDNEQVEELLNNIDISKIEERDAQEVVGYFNAMDLIIDVSDDIDIKESDLKNLHNVLLKYSKKDEWHRGDYKQHSNAVQASFPDGTKQIIFQTTEPGYPTEDAIRLLINWYESEKEVHPLIKCGTFVYDFLSIHPFQDGNGRLSRILTTLLLLKTGYSWIQYVSLEHEIENRKKAYYRTLRSCQAQRPGEDISEWIEFFLDSLVSIQRKLQNKLNASGVENNLSPKEKEVYVLIENNPGIRSGQITNISNFSKPTVKRIIAHLIEKKLIQKFGKGAGTNYSTI